MGLIEARGRAEYEDSKLCTAIRMAVIGVKEAAHEGDAMQL